MIPSTGSLDLSTLREFAKAEGSTSKSRTKEALARAAGWGFLPAMIGFLVSGERLEGLILGFPVGGLSYLFAHWLVLTPATRAGFHRKHGEETWSRCLEYFQALHRYETFKHAQRAYWTGFIGKGHAFEEEVAALLRECGYWAKKTRGSGDQGIDVEVRRPDGARIVVQCKAQKRPIPPKDVQAFHGAWREAERRGSYEIQEAWLVALGGFGPGAVQSAGTLSVELLGIDDLVSLRLGSLHS